MKVNIIQELLTNKVNLLSLAGFSATQIIKKIELVSSLFDAAQPILTGIIAITIVSYNGLNIYKKLNDKK